jgi:hypothetical protein
MKEKKKTISRVKGLFIYTMTTTMIVCKQPQIYIYKENDFSGEGE